ncbi:enoyl-CoA hydratase/isomerase family protein [Arthrobacter sp. CAN_C5]|uniref:enoyl-CoA hydratase/isomerase family protein n=1 Tax=Arthrobacter sp. CAN_C5 TaxID=2760706 RepID=UPI001AE32518|nr:enoyl-CoA hydratase-related protein [Arthrobacter sp. CAN_C5]MBP2217551.1 enoyl-CoA hydratase/carnithine racemase [Arthrobacter sp. CAN_C5]
MEFTLISAESINGLGIITINRPASRNALNRVVLDEIAGALDLFLDDEGVGAVIFTGAGGKAFIAGADINQLANYTLVDGLSGRMQRLYDTIEAYELPTIAAINGYALGGGLELAMACDIRIAVEGSRFALPETNLGIIPGAGGTQRLSRLVGRGRAVELILTGRLVDAPEALGMGLVTDVVPSSDLMDTVRKTADTILAKGPLAVRLAKMVVKHGFDTDQQTGLLLERLAQSLLYTTQDKAEGTAAFLEKRSARYVGK